VDYTASILPWVAVGDGVAGTDSRDIFLEAKIACKKAIGIFSESSEVSHKILSVETKAILAEVYYCAASGTSRTQKLLLITEEEGTVPWMQSFSLLKTKSIGLLQEALEELRVLGLGRSQTAAIVLKDLGKVQNFDGQQNNSRNTLNEALDIQIALSGPDHPWVDNIRRLMR
jgi:hypothetical protein